MALLVALALHCKALCKNRGTLLVLVLAFTRLVKARRRCEAFPLHKGSPVVSCSPKIKPPPLVQTALEFTKRLHTHYLIWPSFQACEMSVVVVAPILHMRKCSTSRTQSYKGRSFWTQERTGMTPAIRSLAPGRLAGPPPPLSCWGSGDRGGSRSEF